MSTEDSELLKEFAVESQEHLADIENKLLSLEGQGDAMDVALVNTVFRAIHSIKGAAGFMGLDTLGGLAHRAEEVLNRMRNRDLRPTSLVISTLLRATDQLKVLIDDIENSNGADVTAHLAALEAILSGQSEEPAAPRVQSAAPEQPGNVASVIGSEALREFLVECFDNVEQLERDLLILERQQSSESVINSVFRNVHTIKGSAGFLGYTKLEKVTHAAENLLGLVRSGTLSYDANVSECLLKTIDLVRTILGHIETSGLEGSEDLSSHLARLEEAQQPAATSGTGRKKKSTPKKPAAKKAEPVAASDSPAVPATLATHEPVVTPAVEPLATVAAVPDSPVSKPVVAPPAVATAAAPTATPTAPAASSAPAASEPSASESTIRVDVALLDKLMTRVGELVLARNQILQFNNQIGDSALHGATQRLNLITTELQEAVMKTRMQPIGNVWSKFPRLVRDLAGICGKQVRIEMEGKDTELDKTIIEAIKDPLTHLVRNTVDHGIEKAEVRIARGKPVEGCLTLRAYHEGGQVNIEIVDDGGGLNFDRIRSKAIEKNLITPEHAAKLSEREVGNLIFLPGFSTAEQVSSVSGRGVGMDVVKTNIEKIGGTVDLQSKPGEGTVIKIKIPLTLAIIPALIVTSAGDRYAIPQVNLLELVRLEGDDAGNAIEWIQDAPVYRLRGRLLPLVYLREQLHLGTQKEGEVDAVNIVVLRADDRQFGLVVDRINDSEEIVVKPLSKQLKGVPVYSGTTIMGDGRVALILDVMGVAHSANVVCGSRDRAHGDAADSGSGKSSQSQTLLVLGVGESRRFAVPIDQVTRLEKISADSIEYADQQMVVQYRGEILPLIQMSDALGVCSMPSDQSELDVVVYSESHKTVGLVVDRIIDIVETELASTRSASHQGLIQSAVVNDHVTDLLDLPAIMRLVNPSFYQESVGA